MKTIAIIGVSTGQRAICLKAREMGLRTLAFGWDNGAVCKSIVDKYYPISITDVDNIVDICRKEAVSGVVSNASDLTVKVVSAVSTKLGLRGNDPVVIDKILNKFYVREVSGNIQGLSNPKFCLAAELPCNWRYPCIVKPVSGSGKQGVMYVETPEEMKNALNYTSRTELADILVEEYISGRELSVEAISYKGKHQVIQITDKENTGSPHFVEIGHHQPADLTDEMKGRIETIVRALLDQLNYQNGASHIEIKVDNNDNIYLIEINPRGGGDEISNQLVKLSTGIDYLHQMIAVSLDSFEFVPQSECVKFAGIYFLCQQTAVNEKFIKESDDKPYFYSKYIAGNESLTNSTSNKDRDGYMIYCSDHKIFPK